MRLYRVEILEQPLLPSSSGDRIGRSWSIGPALAYDGEEAPGIHLAPMSPSGPTIHYLIWPGPSAETVRSLAVQWSAEYREIAAQMYGMVLDQITADARDSQSARDRAPEFLRPSRPSGDTWVTQCEVWIV